jgi:hypothetical protein
MATYIVTYDLKKTVPDPHTEFLERASKLGWMAWALGSNNIWYRLPNTTLVGTFASIDAADQAFEATRTATEQAIRGKVIIEKFIIAEYGAARFNSDVKQPKR